MIESWHARCSIKKSPTRRNDAVTQTAVTQTAHDFTKTRRSSLIAAVFMMATSAIGPGFITQTTTFTPKMGAAFALGILASSLIDFVVQLNVWRIVTLTRLRDRKSVV